MGKEEFKAMVELIDQLNSIHGRLSQHPNDVPRTRALYEERRDVLVEAAREIIDEPWEKEWLEEIIG
jgi:hypothetical protein